MLRKINLRRCVNSSINCGQHKIRKSDVNLYKKCFQGVHFNVTYLSGLMHLFPQNRIHVANELDYTVAKLDEHGLGQSIDLRKIYNDEDIKSAKNILQSMNDYSKYEYDALLVRYNLNLCRLLAQKGDFANKYTGSFIIRISDTMCKKGIMNTLNRIDHHLSILSHEMQNNTKN